MRIRLLAEVAIALEACTAQARSQEFSGLGFVHVDREKQEFVVYDIVPLNVGTYSFTEIPPEKILPILQMEDAKNLKCWLHRHPVGDGKPGPHNWSGTDNATIAQAPLGGVPELVGWSISIVRTPKGWVGRVDNHKTRKTEHLEVVGQAPRALIDAIDELYREYMDEQPFRGYGRVLQPSLFDEVEEEYEEEAIDVTEEIVTANFTQRLRDIENSIAGARSIADFEAVERSLDDVESELLDAQGSPPLHLMLKIDDLKETFQAAEVERLLIEEDGAL